MNRAAYYDEEPMVAGWLKLVFSVPAWFLWMVLTVALAPRMQIDLFGESRPDPGSPEASAEAAVGPVLLALLLGSAGTAVGLIRLLVRGPRAWMLTALFVAVASGWAIALLVAWLQ